MKKGGNALHNIEESRNNPEGTISGKFRQAKKYESGIQPVPKLESDIELHYSHLSKFLDDILNGHPDESFYFLNIGKIRERVGILRDYFLPGDPRRAIAYAIKANPHPRIVQTLDEEGIQHFDCASMGEIEQIREHAPKAKIFYNQPVKPATAIRRAEEKGVTHFTAQSCREVEKICQNTGIFQRGSDTEIVARLQTHNENAAINLSSKFGAPSKDVAQMIHMIRDVLKRKPGVSIHTGSQNSDVHIFTTAIHYMAEVAKEAGGVNVINVGGGIPVNYFEQNSYDIKEYLQVISEAVRKNVEKVLINDADQTIAIELGRAVVAEAVDLVIPVLAVEERERPTIYFNDGIFTSFSDHSIHGWRYNFETYRKGNKPLSLNKKSFVLHGRTCDSGDTLGEVHLPEDIEEGDYIWVSNAGAYTDAQATRFNGFDPPKYIIYNCSL